MRQLVDQARAGSVRAASRLISLLEDDPALLPSLFTGMSAWPAPRLVLGVTGPPGVGKSTLVDALVRVWRARRPDGRVGVLAVDPSSPFTGGAVLGDRIRMMDHATDERVFIRSLASRGHLGGLTLGIRGSVRVMGLLGCDVVLLETVGVGQSEVEVCRIADLTAVVLAAGAGDGIQLLKAGLMEAADLFVINKADKPGADKLAAELMATLGLAKIGQPSARHAIAVGHSEADLNVGLPDGDSHAVIKVSAQDRIGTENVVEQVEAIAARSSAAWQARRNAALHDDVREAVLEEVRRRTAAQLGETQSGTARIAQVLSGASSVAAMAAELMAAAARGSATGERST